MDISSTPSEYQKPKNLAGLGRRWGGQIIDSIVTFALFFIVARVLEFVGVPASQAGLVGFCVGVAYYLFSDAMPNGQSIGKKLLGMAVIDERSYMDCNLYQSFMRNITTPFLNFFDWIFIFFGSRKRLGDMLASTIVIRAK
ncbi:RDD family protein [Pseudomonas sp. P2757]|uniref:RDD family protein n=1 Tax=unclassified Pseudomonas TaxID=196821 RepID=UPI003B5A50E9